MNNETKMTHVGGRLEGFARRIAALTLIAEEYDRASQAHPPLNSAHEGYAVILEELDELKYEVWKRASDRDPGQLLKEAAQVGAMAVRFITDLCMSNLYMKETEAIYECEKKDGSF